MDGSLSAPLPAIDWLDIDEARCRVRRRIDRFVAEAAGPDAEPTAALALRVSPGVGKTRTTLEAIARRAPDLLARGHVLVFVPTLKLADEAQEVFLELAPDVPSMVFRGRLAARPGGKPGELMCSRPQLIAALHGKVASIGAAACVHRRNGEDFDVAPCFQGCAYYAQKPVGEHRIIFLAHSLLSETLPFSGEISLVVIDEKVWSSRIGKQELAFDRWMREPCGAYTPARRSAFDRMTYAVWCGLTRGEDLCANLARAGIGAEDFLEFAEAEWEGLPSLPFWPSREEESLERALIDFDVDSRAALGFRARSLRLLAEADGGPSERVRVEQRPTPEGPRAFMILHTFRELPRLAPTLLLDADADEVIVERLVPGAAFCRIDVKPLAEIVQITDRTLSPSSLMSVDATGAPSDSARRLRAEIEALIEREVGRTSGAALVVAPKATLNLFPSYAAQGTVGGASARHLGPSMQGINTYRHHDTVIVLGRLQPRPRDVEAQARSLFGDRGAPLVLGRSERFEAVAGSYLLEDGTTRPATLNSHPDPRVAALLMQIREASTLQAIARLRLTDPSGPKRVIIACSIPLPGVPVSRLTTWQALLDGVPADVEDSRRYALLSRAVGLGIQGVRLSKAGLAEDLHSVLDTSAKAAEFRRSLSTDALMQLVLRVGRDHGQEARLVTLTRPGRGGRPCPALLLGGAQAENLWPGWESKPA